MSCEEKVYNQFNPILGASRKIVDYLFTKAPNLWKLLYYQDTQPLLQPDLTNTQKASMICKNPAIDSSTATKNILFQLDTEEGMDIAVPQIRIRVGDINPINPYQGWIEVVFRIVVPNKMGLITTEYSDVENRELAIFYELNKALNGSAITNAGFNSPMFMNRSAPDGAGRKTGAFFEGQNKSYSGYWVSYSVLV